jgi:isopropylmalate/homocitrate/citramalate synthase
MYAHDLPIFQVLFAMNRIDPTSVGRTMEKMQRRRARGMTALAKKLAEDSVLRDDVTREQATDMLWVL